VWVRRRVCKEITMKLLILFLTIIAISYGKPALNNELQVCEPKKLDFKLNELGSEESLNKFLDALKKFARDGSPSDIVNFAMNPFIDEELADLRSVIIRGGMDPLELEDETLQFLAGIIGSIKLTSGWLQDISTIARNGDVIITYNSATKRITFSVPLSFKVLLFTYKYLTRVTLLSISGDVQGKIDDVRMNLLLTYDANLQSFVLDGLSMKNSGKVTVKFTGNNLVDWITNAMTSVITTVLHPIIVAILQSNVKSIGYGIVDAMNEYIREHN